MSTTANRETIESSGLSGAATAPARVIEHGLILHKPARHLEGTSGDVSYEVGFCAQISPTHCLLIASMDEQGGGDLCVGNDAFVFERLEDIRPERAIPLNRVDPHYKLRLSEGYGFLAKFPARMGFVPLGSKLDDGRDHPAAGTGFALSVGIAKNGKHAATVPETIFEIVQLRWDGTELSVGPAELVLELAGHELNGCAGVSNALPLGESLLLPSGVGDAIRVFQFDYDGSKWVATRAGEPFSTNPGHEALPGEEYAFIPGEIEPSLRRQGDRFFIWTRGQDAYGRLYESSDGLNYSFVTERQGIAIPTILNQGTDGSLYVATNPGPGWLRNPLVGYPLGADGWGEQFTLHDERGVRSEHGEYIPFVDHSIATNVVLEGRRRHFNFFRVCDLTERTLHTFQLNEGVDKEIYGEAGPRTSKLETSGLYLTELVYE